MRGICAAILAAAAVPFLLSAQVAARPEEGGRYAVSSDSLPLSIAEAESRGQQLLNQLALASQPSQNIPSPAVGSSERRCVAVGPEPRALSGDFIAGGFDAYQALWSRGYGKIAWFPVRGSQSSPQHLVVTATRLDGPPDGRVWLETLTRGEYYMYPSGIHVPGAGRWMLVATAGDMWACFVLTVR